MMASYLETHPDDAACIAYWRPTGQFVPIVCDGELQCLINWRDVDKAPLADPLPIEDYVAGLECLGFTFALCAPFDGRDGVLRGEPAETLPEGWDKHALRIMSAFGKRRKQEIVAYLRERDASTDEGAI